MGKVFPLLYKQALRKFSGFRSDDRVRNFLEEKFGLGIFLRTPTGLSKEGPSSIISHRKKASMWDLGSVQ